MLNISYQTYYYRAKPVEDELKLEELVQEEFTRNRKAYGTRELKQYLVNLGLQVSQCRIGRMMKQRGLRSTYVLARFKFHSSICNEAKTANILDGTFLQEKSLEAIVTDPTYVRVGKKRQYTCLILDLFNREIIGYSCGEKKDATLVKEAFAKIPYSLNNVQLFHTDRGKEFDNRTIDEILWAFNITHSLSKKGCPYDNATVESTYKPVKVEFVHQYRSETLANLRLELFDYVRWWSTIRLHGMLDYETLISFRQQKLAQRILDDELGCDTGGEVPQLFE